VARTKEFDPDSALRAAMDLFWRKGYEATSMQDLVDGLGIGRGSIYATFGSKHELYLRALDRYAEQSDVRALDRLSRSGPALPVVREFVRAFLADALTEAVVAWSRTRRSSARGTGRSPASSRSAGTAWRPPSRARSRGRATRVSWPRTRTRARLRGSS